MVNFYLLIPAMCIWLICIDPKNILRQKVSRDATISTTLLNSCTKIQNKKGEFHEKANVTIFKSFWTISTELKKL